MVLRFGFNIVKSIHHSKGTKKNGRTNPKKKLASPKDERRKERKKKHLKRSKKKGEIEPRPLEREREHQGEGLEDIKKRKEENDGI